MNKKNFLLILKSSPHQSCNMQEALDMALAISACEQAVSLLFVDDGVLQLKQQQQAEAIGSKNYAETFKALNQYDINNIYVDERSLADRYLTAADLLITTTITNAIAIQSIINQHDIVLTF